MKICIDPGHGMANRQFGVYDPGAVYFGVREADTVMLYARVLASDAVNRGHQVVMTRRNDTDTCPLGGRAQVAKAFGADVLVSLHTNASPDGGPAPNGTEVAYSLYKQLAGQLSAAVAGALGLRDRGAVFRGDLAVLKLAAPAVLVELGFASNPNDSAQLALPQMPARVSRAILDELEHAIRPAQQIGVA